MGLVDADERVGILPVVKGSNRPLLEAISMTMLFSIFGSICSAIGSIHPKWYTGVSQNLKGRLIATDRTAGSDIKRSGAWGGGCGGKNHQNHENQNNQRTTKNYSITVTKSYIM